MGTVTLTTEEYNELLAATGADPITAVMSLGRKGIYPGAKVSKKMLPKKKRKASAYSKKYGKAFRKVQSKYKTKSGKWKKDGFKKAQKAAHAMAKRMK